MTVEEREEVGKKMLEDIFSKEDKITDMIIELNRLKKTYEDNFGPIVKETKTVIVPAEY